MKLNYNYAALLCRQCDLTCKAYNGEKNTDTSKRIFSDVCKKLTKDFLPPIDREDIAAISYSLLEINEKAERFSYRDPALRQQLTAISGIVEALINKKKTCGEYIRRLVDLNVNFSCESEQSRILNSSISDFIKVANSAYFKNL